MPSSCTYCGGGSVVHHVHYTCVHNTRVHIVREWHSGGSHTDCHVVEMARDGQSEGGAKEDLIL